jgi:hypothetical protein
MSIYTVTVDELMKLDKKTLTYALRIFQQELDGMLALLRDTPEAATDEQVLDDLNSALTLRKVYNLRLEELAAEQGLASKLSSGSTPLAHAA